MKIELSRRRYGVHKLVKECDVPGEFSDYATPIYDREGDERGDFKIDEEKLLAVLPEKFLPVKPEHVLLLVGDEMSSTGQLGLTRFRNWSKYFDAYSVIMNMESE